MKMNMLQQLAADDCRFPSVGKTMKMVLAGLAAMAMSSAFAAASSATTTAAIQAALDQSYPGQGWTVSANGSIDEYGFYNGTDWIQTHPYSQTVPVVLSRTVQVPTDSPWLTFQAASRNSKNGKNQPNDWVCNVKVNGRQIYTKTIATLGTGNPVTIKVPLDDWAGEEVTVALEDAAGGVDNWYWELGYWRGISIYDGGAEDPTPGYQFGHLFPGWRLMRMPVIDSVIPDAGMRSGNVYSTHPFSRTESSYALHEGKLTGRNPQLVVDIASFVSSGTTVHDFIFFVIVNGVYVFPLQEVRSAAPLQFRYPLDRWLDEDSVRIEVHNLGGGRQNAWSYEYALWHRLEIVDAADTVPAAELTYLKATGAQFINTEYLHNPQTVFDMTVKAEPASTSDRYACLMGAGTYSGNAIGFWHQSSATANATFGYGNGGILGGEFAYGVWNELTVSVPERKATWGAVGSEDRTFIASSFNADITGTAPLFIFDRDNSDTAPTGLYEYPVAKLKSASISEGGTKVRDYVPYRRADGICGLKDKVTGVFFPSATAVPFGYGLAYTSDNGNVTVYDGAFSAADDYADWTSVEVVGDVTCDADAALALPGDLVVSGAQFSMSNGVASTAAVAGTLTLKGGTTITLDVTPDANDGFSVGALDLSGAGIENPIELTLALDANVDFSRGFVVIDRGLAAVDGSKFEVTNEGFVPVVEDGALVLRYGDHSSPAISVWTNAKGNGNIADAENWASTNGFGEAVLSVPTSITSVRLPENCGSFSMPVGASLAYREFRMAPSLAGDCDLRGLDYACEGPVDVGTHKLYLSRAMMSSIGTVGGGEGGEVVVDVPADQVWTNSALSVAGAAKLVKSGAGQLDWRAGTIAETAPIDVAGGVLRTVTMSDLFGAGGRLTVKDGARLDLASTGGSGGKHHPLYHRSISIIGAGPDGRGALVNYSDVAEAHYSYLKHVELSGDATIGGTGRIDIIDGTLSGDYKLTVVNSPYLVACCAIDLKEVLATDGGQLAFNPGSESSIVHEGVTLRNGNVSTWTPTSGAYYTLPATVPVRMGAEGGRIYAYANRQTLLGLVETIENSTLNFEAIGNYALVTNNVGCTMNVNSGAQPTFTGVFHNDGIFTASTGTTAFDGTAVVTGSGEIRMSGGSATLGGDASGFEGKLVLSGEAAVSEAGLGSFASCTVIDVSAENGPKNVEGLNWTTAPAGSVLKVRLGSRDFHVGDKVLSWSTAPAESVRFRCDGPVQRNLYKTADGLYVGTGFIVIIH